MAKKPNYRFERSERERLKAARNAARLESKQQKAAERQQQRSEVEAPATATPPVSDK